MKLLFLLIALFVLACVFYGIFSGVSTIRRGVARLGSDQNDPTDKNAHPVQPLPARADMQQTPQPDYIAELQALFLLHQTGALTAAEFGRLKQRLLTEIN